MKPCNNPTFQSIHEQVRLLLPWYVNDTLTKDERRLVEEHFQVCAVCKTERAVMQKLSAFNRQSAVPEISAQASFSRLMQRIDNETKDNRIKKLFRCYRTKFFHVLSSLVGFLPPKPIPLAAALVLLLFSAPAVIVLEPGSSGPPEASYRTLSDSNSLENIGANDIRVIFAENLGLEARARLLAAVHGEIIDGPNARGLYLIRLSLAQDSKPDVAKAIAALRREAGVLFAEPALPPHAAFSVPDGRT
jgi:hypothetical protein